MRNRDSKSEKQREANYNRLKDKLPNVSLKKGDKVPISIRKIDMEDEWIPGVSDGLVLNCSCCGEIPKFDYTVTDEIWRKLIPKQFRKGVVCLHCLDQIAYEEGIDITDSIMGVQFIGIKKTIELLPSKAWYYE